MAFLKRRRFISVIGRKSPMPDGLWMKCPGCKQAVYKPEVEANLQVCPSCCYHHRINGRKRIEVTVDPDTFEETHTDIQTLDPLHFTVGEVTYLSKIEQAKQKSGLQEALITGHALIDGERTVLGVMDPYFMGGSMGSALGEKFCVTVEDAVRERLPLVVFAASGGARMQEGILSLMQMAKTSDAVRLLNEVGLPYIVVLTDPTYGGVYASFASLGDITVAEPGAMCGFAGPRLIEGALKVKLPEGFQSAEYQFEHGFLDQIVKRTEMLLVLADLGLPLFDLALDFPLFDGQGFNALLDVLEFGAQTLPMYVELFLLLWNLGLAQLAGLDPQIEVLQTEQIFQQRLISFWPDNSFGILSPRPAACKFSAAASRRAPAPARRKQASA